MIDNKGSFKNQLVVKVDKEKERILRLKRNFGEGKIKEEQISQADKIILHKMYDIEIDKYKKKIAEYKKKNGEN